MPVPVISVAQMREWEKATWAAGRTESEVIARVGQIVARRAMRMLGPRDSGLALAGKGHNGDDVRQAAEHLSGPKVDLLNVDDPAKGLSELAMRAGDPPALIIDGLFGTGLNRPLDERWIALINHINSLGTPVLSVD